MCMNIGCFFLSLLGFRGLCACINRFSKVLPQRACTPRLSRLWLPWLPERVIDRFECMSMWTLNSKCKISLEFWSKEFWAFWQMYGPFSKQMQPKRYFECKCKNQTDGSFYLSVLKVIPIAEQYYMAPFCWCHRCHDVLTDSNLSGSKLWLGFKRETISTATDEHNSLTGHLQLSF